MSALRPIDALRASADLWAFAAVSFAVIGVYVFDVSAGRFADWPRYTYYYELLARGFEDRERRSVAVLQVDLHQTVFEYDDVFDRGVLRDEERLVATQGDLVALTHSTRHALQELPASLEADGRIFEHVRDGGAGAVFEPRRAVELGRDRIVEDPRDVESGVAPEVEPAAFGHASRRGGHASFSFENSVRERADALRDSGATWAAAIGAVCMADSPRNAARELHQALLGHH